MEHAVGPCAKHKTLERRGKKVEAKKMSHSSEYAGFAAMVAFHALAVYCVFRKSISSSNARFWIAATAAMGGFVAANYGLSNGGVFYLLDGTSVAWVILMVGCMVNLIPITPHKSMELGVAFCLIGSMQRMFLLIGMLSAKSAAAQLSELLFHNLANVSDNFVRTWNGGVTALALVVALTINLLSVVCSLFYSPAANWYIDLYFTAYAGWYGKGVLDLMFSPVRIALFGVPALFLVCMVFALFLLPLFPRSPFAWKWGCDLRFVVFCAIYDVASIAMFFGYKSWKLSTQIGVAAFVDVLALYVLYERARLLLVQKELSKKKE